MGYWSYCTGATDSGQQTNCKSRLLMISMWHWISQVACDGGGGALGHPKVYINLDSGEVQTCPYCGMRFVFDPEAGEVDVRAACDNPLGRCARAEE